MVFEAYKVSGCQSSKLIEENCSRGTCNLTRYHRNHLIIDEAEEGIE